MCRTSFYFNIRKEVSVHPFNVNGRGRLAILSFHRIISYYLLIVSWTRPFYEVFKIQKNLGLILEKVDAYRRRLWNLMAKCYGRAQLYKS